MKLKITLALLLSVAVIIFISQNDSSIQETKQERPTTNEETVEGSMNSSFARCLVDSGVVIYVSKTCPACKDLVNKLGGYDVADGLFVECGQDPALCRANMQTKYVPEIQINGEVVEFQNRIDGLSKETGCILP